MGNFTMGYILRMGIPEMEEIWNTLQTKHRDGTIGKRMKSYIKNGEMH